MPGTNTELFSREAATVGVRKDQVTVQQVQQRGLDSEGRRLSSEEWAERRKAAREREEEEKAHSPACKLCGLDIGDDAMRCNVPRAGLPSTLPPLAPLSDYVHMHCATHIREEWVKVREGYRASTSSQSVRSTGLMAKTLDRSHSSSPMSRTSPINTRLSPSHYSAPPKERISRIGAGSGFAGVQALSSTQEVTTTTHPPSFRPHYPPSFAPLASLPSPIPGLAGWLHECSRIWCLNRRAQGTQEGRHTQCQAR